MTREEFKERFSKHEYLGDSVYVRFDGHHLILETINDDPRYPSNSIGLEPPVFEKLVAYRDVLYKTAKTLE